MSVLTRRGDALAAGAAGAAAGLLYLLTLLPGLGGPEDTPKFQYLGAVLGTAHNPGYPLYVLVTYLFSLLPAGTLAWRINLASAVFGAVTVACLWLVSRRLGASRLGATAIALGAGAGRYLWWNAVMAEVYTLGAALLAAATLKLIDWERTRRRADFYAAVAIAAVSLGNHLSVVAVLPFFVLFVVAVDWRTAVNPRVLAASTGIVLAGLSSYLFIVVRTMQGAANLESRARTIPELWQVIRGRQFDDLMFRFDQSTLVANRLPAVWRLTVEELTPVGLALVLAGAVLAARWAPKLALLFVGGAAGAAILALNIDADLKGFLIPVFVMAWPLAAFVLPGNRPERGPARAAAAAALVLAFIVPAWSIAQNYEVNNQHDDTYFEEYFDALFAWMPERTAFVEEGYVADHMVRYKRAVTGPPARQRQIGLVPPDPERVRALRDEGYAVLAFPEGATTLEGLGFRFAPVTLARSGAGALQPGSGETLYAAGVWPGLPALLGLAADRGMSALRAHYAIAARGGGNTADVDARGGPFVREHGDPAGHVVLEVTATGGRILIDGLPVARASEGVALVLTGADGRIRAATGVAPGEPLRLPLNMARLPLFRLTTDGDTTCEALGLGAWTDITSLAGTGVVRVSVDSFHPFDSTLVMYVEAAGALRPVAGASGGPDVPRVEARRFGQDRPALEASLAADGLTNYTPSPDADIWRVVLTVNDEGDSAHVQVGLGGTPRRVLARGRADRAEAWRVRVCGWRPPVILPADASLGDLWLGPGASTAFGAGWHRADLGRDGPIRWASAREMVLLVSLDAAVHARLHLDVLPARTGGGLRLSVNGHALPRVHLDERWQVVSFEPPPGVWRAGANEIRIETDVDPSPAAGEEDRRDRTLAVRRIRMERIDD